MVNAILGLMIEDNEMHHVKVIYNISNVMGLK